MTPPVDDVLEQIVEDYLSRRTSYVRDRAFSLAYAVHYEVTVQIDATAGDPEVLIEQSGIIPVAMTDLEDIEDDELGMDLPSVRKGFKSHQAAATKASQERASLEAQDHVLRHGERVHEQEVLLHHAEPQLHRRGGRLLEWAV